MLQCFVRDSVCFLEILYYHGSTHVLKFLSDIKPSSFPGLSSLPDIFDIKLEPTVDSTGPSSKPVAQNPIQNALHPVPSEYSCLRNARFHG